MSRRSHKLPCPNDSEVRAAAPAKPPDPARLAAEIMLRKALDAVGSTLKHTRAECDVHVLNALVAEIDGNTGREGMILLAACNHPHRLDPALTRSGRLDRHIHVGLPNRKAFAATIAEHLEGELAGADLSGVALAVAGSTGADCEGEAIKVLSLCGSVEAGGRMGMRSSAEFLVTADITADIAVSLAGRAAEEELLGVPSAGAGDQENSDLALAMHLALISSSALGLQPENGLLWRGMPERHDVGEFLAANLWMARLVADILDWTHAWVRQIVHDHVGAVEAVAISLPERGVLDGPGVETIVREHSLAKQGKPIGGESGR